MRTIEVTVTLTRTVTVPVDDEDVIVTDSGYEYAPGEAGGKGEFWEQLDYSNVDLKEAVLRQNIIPEGWEIDYLELNN